MIRFFLTILLAALPAVPVAAADAAEAGPLLVLESGTGETLFSRPVRVGCRFSVVFTHSLALSRVEEIYEVTAPDEFHLRETVYEDFGAGLPHEEAPGQRMEFSNGRIRLRGYDVRFGELRLRVGHIADHRLAIKGVEVVHLSDLIRPGGEVRLFVTRGPP